MFPNERSGMVQSLTSLWFMKIYSSTGLQVCSWLSQWRWPFRTADPGGVEGLGGFHSFVRNHSQFWMYATLLGWEQFLRHLVVLEGSVSNILPRRLRSLFYASQFLVFWILHETSNTCNAILWLCTWCCLLEKFLLQRRASWTQQVYPLLGQEEANASVACAFFNTTTYRWSTEGVRQWYVSKAWPWEAGWTLNLMTGSLIE